MKIKTVLIVLCMLLLCSCKAQQQIDGDTLRAGVISAESGSDTYKQLCRSMIATLDAEELSSADGDLSGYDMLFIDKSMADKDLSAVEDYVKNGGSVFLDNALYNSFDADFIGAEKFVKLEKCPTEFICPDDGGDMLKIQELLCDFLHLYSNYKNYDVLSQKDYGYGAVTSDAQEVAGFDGLSLYTLNQYGNGYVFFTNPVLPNAFSVNDLTPKNRGEYFSNSTVGANILLQSCFAEFVSIKKYGYAVWRTFGSFGTKPAAWELHYEDITGIENESALKFDKLCREYGQFPSFTLVRNPYTWFERAETVTYIKENNGRYEPDAYENAYSSGKHCVSMKKWLKIGKYEESESYFKYTGEYTLRAYPLPCDFDGDGKTELICGELEYGAAYPIDSPYFPLRDKLQKHIDYFKDNYIYLGVHSLTQKYADEEQECNELSMHKKAFASYGLGWDGLGANQHTWFTSQIGYDGDFDNEQGYDGTYRHQYESGLLWNSGSQTPCSSAVPQISAENSLIIPFELSNGMLMLQPSNTPYGPELFSKTSAKYEVPLLFYNHCDYIYSDEENQEEQIKKVDKITGENGYSFVGEDQLAKAVTAAYAVKVHARREDGKIILSAETSDKHSPLYDKRYADCTGVKVVFGKSEDPTAYRSNASVWRIDNHAVYVSLDKEAEIIKERTQEPHITAVNIPAQIRENKKNITLKFKENGFMQVFTDGYAKTPSDGWETVSQNGKTIFRKYGKASELVIEK